VKKETESEIIKLWKEYRRTKSMEIRDRLILHYSPLVKYVAGKVSVNLPSHIEQADLVSYGILGLIDAIDKYDLDKQTKFETYALPRIRGAIIDELRSLDWVPRSLRSKSRQLERVYVTLENKFKRVPTDEEVAEELEISVDELQKTLLDLSQTSVVALEELWNVGEKGDTLSLLETLEDKKAAEPGVAFEKEELKAILAQAIENLPQREKMVIVLYYYHNLTLKEIGEVLGVTESRVCQMHSRAVLRLRGRLRSTLEG